MSIKIRLLTSYLAMLIIPIVLAFVAAIVIGTVYFGVSFNLDCGSYDFVSHAVTLKEYFGKYFTTLVAVIIIILVLTNLILTYFVSRSITKPIDNLKKAANEIKNGNLDFQIKYTAKDEIGELSSAFEEMRLKLKESIELEQQYEQNRRELVSNISHDLKTPITAVKGYVEGIIDGVADTPEKMDKYIRTIYTKTTEINTLIDELFLYSKLDMKKLNFNFERVDINKYIAHCAEDLAFDLKSKGFDLSFGTNCVEDTLVIADREKLNRVITNIVYNSVKYMNNDKGKIDIRLEEEANDVVVEISDNGPGISETNLPYIFDKFYRGDPARNTTKGGSGLGLSIAKQIIEEHGGIIWARSKKGIGTSINFTLKKTSNNSEAEIETGNEVADADITVDVKANASGSIDVKASGSGIGGRGINGNADETEIGKKSKREEKKAKREAENS